MYLSDVYINNFRSLESVELNGMSQMNALVGRNNAGKTAIFDALSYLGEKIVSGTIYGPGRHQDNVERILTDGDRSRTLRFSLIFRLGRDERKQYIGRIVEGAHYQEVEEELINSSGLRELKVVYELSAPQFNLRLIEVSWRAPGGDREWVEVQSDSPDNQYELTVVNFTQAHGPQELVRLFAGNEARCGTSQRSSPAVQDPPANAEDEVLFWPQRKLDLFFRESFFLSPFRHSVEAAEARGAERLESNGSNLTQVLNTILTGDREALAVIENHVLNALPTVGRIQTPYLPNSANHVQIVFRSLDGRHQIPLHDMGGGVEQLLMTFIVLGKSSNQGMLCLEEPESHLHPAAQRYLLEQLQQSNRQVFISTHSSVFVNLPNSNASVFQIKLDEGRTRVTRVQDPVSLSHVLDDIGVRNSDVLLSDAVLFVEGRGDGDVFQAWSRIIGQDLIENNITVAHMYGGHHMFRTAPVRTEVLSEISAAAPIPHIFVIDRDERSDREIIALQERLEDNVHILNWRELENYLLVPRALLEALREKYGSNDEIRAQVDRLTTGEVERLIAQTANELFDTVLSKRIANEVPPLPGGILPREMESDLRTEIQDPNFSQVLQQSIRERIVGHLNNIDFEAMVMAQRESLEREWEDDERRKELAPGEEILAEIFEHVGGKYNKSNDPGRIARQMREEEIPDEIRTLIEEVTSLADRGLDIQTGEGESGG